MMGNTEVATEPGVNPEPETFIQAALPTVRAIIWGIVGFLAADIITAWASGDVLFTGLTTTIGYIVGTVGFILGSGVWEGWVKPWFGYPDTWDEGTGISRFFRFNTDHKVIGLQYLTTAFATFLVAGLLAMTMRYNLMTPSLRLFPSTQFYNEVMSVHGTLMLFAVAVVAIVGGFGNYMVPIMVGADDMVFPKLNGLSYWFIPAGVMAILLSPLLGGFQTGWTGYAPLSAQDAAGQLWYALGVFFLGLSSMLTAINVIATTIWMRAPGLTWDRLPMFVWGMLVTSLLNMLWLPVVGVGMVMSMTDRLVPTAFFDGSGLPLLWQDLFWLFGHPEVYIIMLTAWALWLEIIPVFGRKTLFGKRWAIAGFLGVVFLSSFVWTHHMFTTVSSDRLIPFMTTTEMISIPTGFMYLAALGTLWKTNLRLKAPLLLVLFSMFNFLIGGLTGVFLSDVPSDFQMHNTYFVVSHFHYTILGGMVFAFFAGMYYWFPKFTGKMYNETWAKINSWALFIFFNTTFFPMQIAGIEGMNRRVAVYLPYLHGINEWISISAFLLGLTFASHAVLIIGYWAWGKIKAPANPWLGKTLEWMTSSPPPHENFEEVPVVTAGFYEYGNDADDDYEPTIDPGATVTPNSPAD